MQQEVINGFRLSPQQRRVWLLQQNSLAYRAQCALLIEGLISVEELKAALNQIVRRNEILRTTFESLTGMLIPVQVIAEKNSSSWRTIDLSEYSSSQQEAEVEELYQAQASASFDYARGPLLRIWLCSLSNARQVLLINMPALCADSWALNNLARELARSLAEPLRDEAPADETLQYSQFAEWQNRLLEEDADEGKQYCQAQASLGVPSLILPLERRDPIAQEFAPESLRLSLQPAVSAQIGELAVRRGVSTSVFLLACWQTLLWQLTRQPEIAVAASFSGRVYEEMKDAFGLYAKWPLIRCRFERDFCFNEVLDRVNKAASEAYEWQEYFSWDLYANSDQDTYKASLSQVAFEFQESLGEVFTAGVRISMPKQFTCTESFKLKLLCASAEDLTLELCYDPAFYATQAVKLIGERLGMLLKNLVESSDVAIGEINVTSDDERHKLLATFNDTARDYERSKLIHQCFEERVLLSPDNPACAFEDEQLSYRKLNARANQLAHYLRSAGVGPESIVGLWTERSVDLLVGVIAILKAGGAYMPVDPLCPAERLAFMLDDAQASVLLTQQRLAACLSQLTSKIICFDSDWEAIAQQSEENPQNKTVAENLAYVLYTSGSTGKPKGVMIQHHSVMNLAAALDEAIYANYAGPLRVSLNAVLSFDSSVKQIIQLLKGHALYIVPEAVRLDGKRLLEFISQNKLDVFDCTPSQLKLAFAESDSGLTLEAQFVLVGGEAIDASTWKTLAAQRKPDYVNVYGPTECTVDATACYLNGAGPGPTIGRPMANVRIYILDERQQLSPLGVSGELYIAGEGVGRGYLNRVDLTAERFVPDPFSAQPGARMYRTGDLGRYREDGNVEFLGRCDDQVKIRGTRIELAEISITLEQHPEVKRAAVMVREDRPDDKRLVAYVLPKQKNSNVNGELRDYMRQKLPEYMIPGVIVQLDDLPLTRNGKVDYQALPTPESLDWGLKESYVASRTPVEEVLVGIWEQILGSNHIGVHDNFFDLGGHSLLATQVISHAVKAFQAEIPLRVLFETPTVAGLAESVERAMREGSTPKAPPITRATRDGEMPLSFAQQRMWVIHELEPDSPVYNLFFPLRLSGEFSARALNLSLSEVVRRHEILRTTYQSVRGRPMQVISPAQPVVISLVDLSALSVAAQEAEAKRLASIEAQRPFNLTQGPVWRALLLEFSEQDHAVLFALHHISGDNWSTGVLVREITALYSAFRVGRTSPLPEPAIQYADFASWQRKWLQGEVLEEQLAYWRRQLAGAPHALELPTDYPRPPHQTFRGAHQHLILPVELLDSIRVLSRRERVTTFMTVLAAFQVLLYRYTSQEDMVIGMPIGNRNRTEIEGLIGFFINTLVLRTDMSGDPTFQQLLQRVREVTLAAYAHQDLPFEKLVDEFQPRRDPSRNPLFQVAFTFQNASNEQLKLDGLRSSYLPVENLNSKFDLTVIAQDLEQGLYISFQYSTDLFAPATIARMQKYFEQLLYSIVAQPHARLSELEMFSEEESLLFEKPIEIEDLNTSFIF